MAVIVIEMVLIFMDHVQIQLATQNVKITFPSHPALTMSSMAIKFAYNFENIHLAMAKIITVLTNPHIQSVNLGLVA